MAMDRGAFWLAVPDEDAWALAGVKHKNGALVATRSRAPDGVPLEFNVTEDTLAASARADGLTFSPPADLIDLPAISTATVLHTLRLRHASDDIYTAVGPVIIAVNPFKPTKESSNEKIEALLREDPDKLPPHVFNVARSAYSVMVATGGPQSILISGESGAGKTESAKLCMTCLAQLSASPAEVAATALESGLLLESFGNARTVYNDNSSRFGKWVEVHFDKRDCISSACIRSYLLEISRVVKQAPGERNYHVFNYLLAANLSKPEREAFGLPAGGACCASRLFQR
jgi:myosin-7